MSVVVKPTNVIKAELGLQPNGPVQQYFTKAVADHMDQYVPYDEGNLAYKQRVIETDKIRYQSRYAHYLYVGKVLGPNIPIKENGVIVGWFSRKGKTYTGKDIDYSKSKAKGHVHAGPYWDKRMWSAEKQDVINEVKEYIRHGGY